MTSTRNKKYLVFAGQHGSHLGGWTDFILATDDAERAIDRAKLAIKGPVVVQGITLWAEVIDTEVGLPVWREGFDHRAELDDGE